MYVQCSNHQVNLLRVLAIIAAAMMAEAQGTLPHAGVNAIVPLGSEFSFRIH